MRPAHLAPYSSVILLAGCYYVVLASEEYPLFVRFVLIGVERHE
jgi:hypothetical protein